MKTSIMKRLLHLSALTLLSLKANVYTYKLSEYFFFRQHLMGRKDRFLLIPRFCRSRLRKKEASFRYIKSATRFENQKLNELSPCMKEKKARQKLKKINWYTGKGGMNQKNACWVQKCLGFNILIVMWLHCKKKLTVHTKYAPSFTKKFVQQTRLYLAIINITT